MSSTPHFVSISALVAFSVLTSLPLVSVVRARRSERHDRREWDAFELGITVARQMARAS